MTKLAGRVALVTGSSRGIGAAIARLFAEEGAAVGVHGRDEVAVASVRDDIAAAGGNVIAVTGEVRDLQQIDAIRPGIESELGPVDLLVGNAGGNFTAPGTILTEDNLQRIPEPMRHRMAASHPIARLGTPEDVACGALPCVGG